jgi:hypothetical protein
MAVPEKAGSSLDALPDPNYKSSKTFYFGVVLYLVSFFLPAVWLDHFFVPGWACAYLALSVWATDGFVNAGYQLGVRLTIFGGLINLLAITYAVLRQLHRTPRGRLTVALALVACMPPMWLSLYLLDAPPYLGHAAWISGLLLMIFGDAWVLGRRRLLLIASFAVSYVLALVSHGVIISRDPLAHGPSLWGFTLERNPFAGEPMLWGLLREFPSQNQFNPIPFFLSLSVDWLSWLVILLAASKLMHVLWGKKKRARENPH